MDDASWPAGAQPLAQVSLALSAPAKGEESPSHEISAAAAIGNTLFLGADECAALEVLHRTEQGYAEHRRLELAEVFDLPEESGEMDIEGVAVCDGWVWIVGSHSLTRKKPKGGGPLDAKALKRLAKLKDNHNRMFLGRLPLRPLGDGRWEPCAKAHDGRRPQMLPVGKHASPLLRRLRHHPLLGPFTDLPAKENGLDVEGVVVDGHRVGLGLRGPVINGWALIVEVEVHGHGGKLELHGDEPRLHVLDLGGLGVRDLKRLGDEVLILAGPTMKLDGPVHVFRWRGWAAAPHGGDLLQRPERVLGLPFGTACDHPEAMATVPHDDAERLLVVCDKPGPARLAEGRILADLFALPV